MPPSQPTLRSRTQRDLREPVSPFSGSRLFFSGAYSTAAPSAFEMPETPADEAGFFIFEGK